jgi:hypothetical protein
MSIPQHFPNKTLKKLQDICQAEYLKTLTAFGWKVLRDCPHHG